VPRPPRQRQVSEVPDSSMCLPSPSNPAVPLDTSSSSGGSWFARELREITRGSCQPYLGCRAARVSPRRCSDARPWTGSGRSASSSIRRSSSSSTPSGREPPSRRSSEHRGRGVQEGLLGRPRPGWVSASVLGAILWTGCLSGAVVSYFSNPLRATSIARPTSLSMIRTWRVLAHHGCPRSSRRYQP
jgi:hypothetical protein